MMMRWSYDAIKQIKPHHLVRSIQNPRRAFRELKYRYTFSKKVPFCTFITGVPENTINNTFHELYRDHDFIRSVKENHDLLKPGANRGAMASESELLYVLVRSLKPEIILETGVGAGVSSAYILRAIYQNGSGKLYSIDLPDDSGLSGWAVPAELCINWDLRLGSSSNLLENLLSEIKFVDIFLHDSDHSYENMMYEFASVWPYIRDKGLFLAHDVGRNDALFDFCKTVGVSWTQVRTFPVLGAFRKI